MKHPAAGLAREGHLQSGELRCLGYNPGLDIERLPAVRPRFLSMKNMTSILKLRGALALSSSRLERLSRAVAELQPRLKALAAEHWYFVEISAPLSIEEQERLADLLDARPATAVLPAGP